jgi:hypothetical protein
MPQQIGDMAAISGSFQLRVASQEFGNGFDFSVEILIY